MVVYLVSGGTNVDLDDTQWDWKNRERDLPDCIMRMWFNYMEKTGQNLITGFDYEKKTRD